MTLRISTSRPRGLSASSPVARYVGHASRQNPQWTQLSSPFSTSASFIARYCTRQPNHSGRVGYIIGKMRKPSPAPDPFACLFERFGGEILGLLIRLTHGDRAEAEDLTQETFMAAFQGQKSYSGRVPIRAWLAGIAVRRLRDSQRRPRPKQVALIVEPPALPLTERDVPQRVVLEQALAQFPDSQQAAILLVLVRGLTYKEAASALGEPEGTIKWRVSEASKKLRLLLSESETEIEK